MIIRRIKKTPVPTQYRGDVAASIFLDLSLAMARYAKEEKKEDATTVIRQAFMLMSSMMDVAGITNADVEDILKKLKDTAN